MPLFTFINPAESVEGNRLLTPHFEQSPASEELRPSDPIWSTIQREAKEEERRGSGLCLFLNKAAVQN